MLDPRLCPQCRRWFRPTRVDAVTCGIRCRVARQRRLVLATPPLPEEIFDLLHADCPWDFATRTPAGQGRRPPYPVMDVAAICRLPIARIAAPNAVLAIWVPG